MNFPERSGFAMSRCSNCGLVFLSDVKDAINDTFFEDTNELSVEKSNDNAIEYWSFPKLYDKHRVIFDEFFTERFERLNRLSPNFKSLLDVGCGYGLFLNHIHDKVPLLQGIELDPAVAQFGREHYQLNIDTSPIERFQTDTRFEVITMCDVLEHLHEPLFVLESCRNLLVKNGLILIQVPNLLGFKLPLNHSWGLPHHIWQFSVSSLKHMLETNGFQVVAHTTGVMGVVGVYETRKPTFKDHLSWWAGRKFGIGNRLMMFARRID